MYTYMHMSVVCTDTRKYGAVLSNPPSVTKERTEVVFEGTYNATLGQTGELAQWHEIEFKCKPGSVSRRPCVISPYHYRLDWLMWFAAFQVEPIHMCSVMVLERSVVSLCLLCHRTTSTTPGCCT